MEMRGVEDAGMGEDLTPPLPPLAFCLHRSFLATHCSACSLPLPPNPIHAHPLLYCSLNCSSLHSSLHSHHNLHHSSAVRLSLRLANLLRQNQTGAADLARIGGLLTNYQKIIAREEDDEVLHMVKEGAAAMIVSAGNFGDDVSLAEAVMCLVLTNAVEVQDRNGSNVGIAVYDWAFSWINHSCSPNAFYRFTAMVPGIDSDSRLRIYPAVVNGAAAAAAGDWKRSVGIYGPRIIIRSIKGIKKNEEVTIAYTDLLQPKGLRQSELLSKYQFNCCCNRCRATPATYVDRYLQAIFVCSPDGYKLISDDDFYKSTEAQKLMDAFDNAVDEYLQYNNPENCCIKLDELLTHAYHDEQLKPKPERSQSFIRLHQFHHLSLSAYTTLASAYRVRSSDLMASASESHKHQDKAFNMSRTSAAYSLLLAIVTHHLFQAEPSLIVSVANHWKNAGESLICLSRSSAPDMFQKQQLSNSDNWLGTSHKCYQIVQPDGSDDKHFAGEMLADMSSELLNCIINLAEKMWNLLTQEVGYLAEIKNVVDFRGLLVVEPCPDPGIEHTEQDSVHLFHLGFHCLIFGMYLSALCFDKKSALDIVNFFHNNFIFHG